MVLYMDHESRAEQRQQVIEMLRSGASMGEVVSATRLSPAYISKLAIKAGMRKRSPYVFKSPRKPVQRLSKAEKAARSKMLADRYKAGETLEEIGASIGMTR